MAISDLCTAEYFHTLDGLPLPRAEHQQHTGWSVTSKFSRVYPNRWVHAYFTELEKSQRKRKMKLLMTLYAALICVPPFCAWTSPNALAVRCLSGDCQNCNISVHSAVYAISQLSVRLLENRTQAENTQCRMHRGHYFLGCACCVYHSVSETHEQQWKTDKLSISPDIQMWSTW